MHSPSPPLVLRSSVSIDGRTTAAANLVADVGSGDHLVRLHHPHTRLSPSSPLNPTTPQTMVCSAIPTRTAAFGLASG